MTMDARSEMQSKPLAGRLLTGFACLVLLGCSDDAGSYADGIHHTAAGYAVRNEAIAHALAGFYLAP